MTQLVEKLSTDQSRIASTIESAMVEAILREDPDFYHGDADATEVTAGIVIVAIARRSEAGVLVEGISHHGCPLENVRTWQAIEQMVKAETKSAIEKATNGC